MEEKRKMEKCDWICISGLLSLFQAQHYWSHLLPGIENYQILKYF